MTRRSYYGAHLAMFALLLVSETILRGSWVHFFPILLYGFGAGRFVIRMRGHVT
jgi:hypothetical protein